MARLLSSRWTVLLVFPSIAVVLYGWALFGDEALFGRDVLHHYWPMRAKVATLFSRGELPQWDGSLLGGVPLLGNIHAAVLYPPNVLFQFVSFPKAYAWLLALHQVVLMVGAQLWLKRSGASRI